MKSSKIVCRGSFSVLMQSCKQREYDSDLTVRKLAFDSLKVAARKVFLVVILVCAESVLDDKKSNTELPKSSASGSVTLTGQLLYLQDSVKDAADKLTGKDK